MHRLTVLGVVCGLVMTSPHAHATSATLPDPMRPPVVAAAADTATAAPAVEYTLQAIKFEPAQRAALINGALVREGMRVDGAKVLKISSRSVVIASDKETITLRLHQNDFKQAAKVGPEPPSKH